ncbi:MAG: bifunctional adenosylcobinamide kinase/adenosylcobinamide-phosphate guanylyltransferase [Hyphomicrobiales bacterium]|nr:bifunctional adenosylcobinamide kinase/adenosylcobinamide-phosphate guanylyltransferase [Hyphomicrobiales bacterium]
MSARTIFVLGGARSGKTSRALSLAETFSQRIYIATAQALDTEMEERIARHKLERGNLWTTVEAPLDLPRAIGEVAEADAVCVIDCLTLWLSNLMGADRDIAKETARLCNAVAQARPALILVSNEVGLGIVPDNALARAFRDHQGRLNQAVAASVDCVEFVAAGLPLRLKG